MDDAIEEGFVSTNAVDLGHRSPGRLRSSWANRHRRKLMANVFSELFAVRSDGERFAAYVIREHRAGRAVADILDDPYLRNKLSDARCRRLLDRPDVIRAVAEDMGAARSSRPDHR